jgi:formamidopyrimidine-DNA glycosylase
MPELPEVETVARGLQARVAGRRIVSVTLRQTDFMDDPVAIERELPGKKIEWIERFGKFMLLRLTSGEEPLANNATESPRPSRGQRRRKEKDGKRTASEKADGREGAPRRKNEAREGGADGDRPKSSTSQENERALLVHLGMTGNLAPHFAEQPLAKHTHATFALDDGRELRYVDPRRFGRMAYLAGETLAAELLRFGADPLLVTAEEFAARTRRSRARIKALLLNQRVLRGVGNIYADESLWKAKIHPAKQGAQLKREDTERLLAALQKILQKAIEMRGSSISDFVDAEGLAGDYQQHHKVYGRDGKKCFRCRATIQRMVVAGRSSHFCPVCQRAPRGLMGRQKKAKRAGRVGTSKR